MVTQVYTAGSNVTADIEVPKYKDEVITASSISYDLYDQDEGEVSTNVTVAGYQAGDTTIEIETSAAQNDIGSAKFGARKLVVRFQTADDGEFTVVYRYLVSASSRLEMLANTFMAYDRALVTRMDFASLNGWDAASEDQRISALIHAHKNLTKLRFRFPPEETNPVASQSHLKGLRTYTYVTDMSQIDQADWDTFTPSFKSALRAAQLLEADSLLAGDIIRDKREKGIVSETVGESKLFFNNRPPLRLGVSIDAFEQIQRFVHFSMKALR